VAATGSDPAGASGAGENVRRLRQTFRPTLRLRLTVLYGLCFLVAGASLLGITYALVAHDTGNQQESLVVRGPRFQVTALHQLGETPSQSASSVHLAGHETPAPSHGSATTISGGRVGEGGGVAVTRKVPPNIVKQVAKAQAEGQALLNFVTARANVNLKTQRSKSLASLLTWSGIVLGVMALLSILLGWLLAGRALRPIRTMNTRAREITEENLHERLGEDRRDDELGDLAQSFDELLARLERAFDSQRRFVANASHELRTPVTLARTLVEVALADPDASAKSLRHVCERVLVSTEQQERMIEALLTLARSQAGVESGVEIDLAELVDDTLLAREARLAGIEVQSDLQSAVVKGDPALIERLVANLVDNAALHNAGPERWIRVRTGQAAGSPVLWIANSGAVIPQEQVHELFEPFRRLEEDRVAGDGGLGLGLSIVQAIATAHEAELTAVAPPEGGLAIELRFGGVSDGLYPESENGSHQRVFAGSDRTG
jgi:signal transduction histidine kinase